MNRVDAPDYNPGLQRHHLLPLEVLKARSFARLFDGLGAHSVGFDDFRRNGLLLPGTCETARLLSLPLHRGPHRHYTAVVMERVGAVERDWARRAPATSTARQDALFRLALLQVALRRSLLCKAGPRTALNRQDPVLRQELFVELDAMADRLWADTGVADQDRMTIALRRGPSPWQKPA